MSGKEDTRAILWHVDAVVEHTHCPYRNQFDSGCMIEWDDYNKQYSKCCHEKCIIKVV